MGFEDSMYDDGFNNPQDYFDHLCNESYKDTWKDYEFNEDEDGRINHDYEADEDLD